MTCFDSRDTAGFIDLRRYGGFFQWNMHSATLHQSHQTPVHAILILTMR